jgi:ABC-type Na+ efflux pump permease subunit
MCLKTQLDDGAFLVLNWLKYVDLTGAVVVIFAFGIVVGELHHDSVQQASKILTYLASAVAIVFGLATLYFTQYDQRRNRNFLLIAVVAFTVVSNIGHAIQYFNHTVNDILFSFGSMVVATYLMIGALRGYRMCKRKEQGQ